MSNLEIELNSDGVVDLLKSREMADFCEEIANRALTRLGTGYEVSTYYGKNRLNVSVKAETHAARADNLENNSILKALR